MLKLFRTTAIIAACLCLTTGLHAQTDIVQWGSTYNMRRLATSETDSTPTSPVIATSFSQNSQELGLGTEGANDSRLGNVFSPRLSGMIDPEGADLSTRTFYWVGEQILSDANVNTGNRRIGATSSYSTSADWRGSAFEQYQMYAWHKDDFLAPLAGLTLNDPDASMSVNMRSFTNNVSGTGLHFVIKNDGTWYYSEAATTGTGTFTLANPGAANWAVFNPEALSSDITTARTMAMPSTGSFGTVVFDDIQYVGFATEAIRTSNGENRMGFDNFVVTAIPEPGTLVLVGIALGSLLFFRRRR